MYKHTLYKTTNLVNKKYYYGVHTCNCSPCSYLGSGTVLANAITKYGSENFSKEIIAKFKYVEDAYAFEKLIVTKQEVKSQSCYNISLGGKGGSKLFTPCSWAGIDYSSKIEACRSLGISIYRLNKALASGSLTSSSTSYSIEGNHFESRNEAAKFYKVCPQTISKWDKSPNRPNCFSINP